MIKMIPYAPTKAKAEKLRDDFIDRYEDEYTVAGYSHRAMKASTTCRSANSSDRRAQRRREPGPSRRPRAASASLHARER